METIVQIVTPLITALVGYLLSRARGNQQQQLSDLLWSGLKEEIQRLVADPTAGAVARSKLTTAAWLLLERFGAVKRDDHPAWAAMLVDVAVQNALAEVEHILGVQRAWEASWRTGFDALSRKLDDAVKAFTSPTPGSSTMPRLSDAMTIRELALAEDFPVEPATPPGEGG